jgi:hypothetical protein
VRRVSVEYGGYQQVLVVLDVLLGFESQQSSNVEVEI